MSWEYEPTVKKAGATRKVTVNFEDQLAPDETLTGTPTVIEQSAAPALTISEEAISGADCILRGVTIEAGHAVQFLVAGGVSRTDYTIRIRVDTSIGQVLEKDMRLKVI